MDCRRQAIMWARVTRTERTEWCRGASWLANRDYPPTYLRVYGRVYTKPSDSDARSIRFVFLRGRTNTEIAQTRKGEDRRSSVVRAITIGTPERTLESPWQCRRVPPAVACIGGGGLPVGSSVMNAFPTFTRH